MKNFTGFIIRQQRLQKGLSQEELCKGICAVSYLSKIEQGIGNPSPAILDKLYQALGIHFSEDAALTAKAEAMITSFFDKYFHNEAAEEESAYLKLHQKELENCELHLTWHLFNLYDLIRKYGKKAPLCHQEAAYLSKFRENMDNNQLFLYYAGCGQLESEDQLDNLRLAENLFSNSFVKQAIAECYYTRKEYMFAISAAENAFAAGAEEGRLSTLLWSSYLLGACYSNFNDVSFMLKYYKRALELSRGYDEGVSALIQFNIGSAYLEHKMFAEAIPYLLASLKSNAHGMDEQKVLTGQKLAVCYFETDNPGYGNQYLQQAINRRDDRMPKIYDLLLYFTQLRYIQKQRSGDEYIETLTVLLKESREQLGEGYYRLLADWMIDYLVEQRRYKDALNLKNEIAFV